MVADGFRMSEERAARLVKVASGVRTRDDEPAGDSDQPAGLCFAGPASSRREFLDAETDLKHGYLVGGAYQVWCRI
jgi:hypothetical protein